MSGNDVDLDLGPELDAEAVQADLAYELRFARIRYASLLSSLADSAASVHGVLSDEEFIPEAGLVVGSGLLADVVEMEMLSRMIVRYSEMIPEMEEAYDWGVTNAMVADELRELRVLNNEMRAKADG